MKTKIHLFLIFSTLFLSCQDAKNVSIVGEITNSETQEKIKDATVIIESSSIGRSQSKKFTVKTDNRGWYQQWVGEATYIEIQVKAAGFKSKTISFKTGLGGDRKDLQLSPKQD